MYPNPFDSLLFQYVFTPYIVSLAGKGYPLDQFSFQNMLLLSRGMPNGNIFSLLLPQNKKACQSTGRLFCQSMKLDKETDQ
jgi:hypothetical protein